ncbi:hypothetical protein Droror1_Dr00027655 [Drosera rotundifolia]
MLALHHLTIPASRFPTPPLLHEHPRCRLHLPAMKPEHSHYVAATALWDYQLLFMSQRLETSQPITLHPVEGSLPRDFPSGTYYLIGPGQMSDDHGSMVSPLDGHGYLRVFEVDGENGTVRYQGKYVRTEVWEEEYDVVNASWRFSHRGPFSVLKGGKVVGNVKVMKNVANTSVLWWGGRLFCLWEGGVPYEIDKGSLDTIGRFDIGLGKGGDGVVDDGVGDVLDVVAGLLKPVLYGIFRMPPRRILSHYKVDSQRNRLLVMSCNAEDMLLPRSHFTFYEFDPNFNLLQTREFSIDDHLMIHDWAFTDTRYILFANRVKLDASGSIRAVSGLSPMISALSVNPGKQTTPIYLLPRFVTTDGSWRVPVEAPTQLWLLHAANAFDTQDEENGNLCIWIHATACSYQWFKFHQLFGYKWRNGWLDPSLMNADEGEVELLPHLVQVSINLDARGHFQKCGVEPLSEHWTRPSDFSAINPEYAATRNTYVYAVTASGFHPALPHFPFDTVLKLNTLDKSVRIWYAGSRRFVGEPVFVTKEPAAEDDGYLLVVEYAVSVQRCYLIVLNPKRIGEADALVARFEVPKFLTFPYGFHGIWVSK